MSNAKNYDDIVETELVFREQADGRLVAKISGGKAVLLDRDGRCAARGTRVRPKILEIAAAAVILFGSVAGDVGGCDQASGEPSLQIVSTSHVSTDNPDYPHVESFIAVDPRDVRHLLATSMVFVDGNLRTFPYVSFDAGATWTRGRIDGDDSITTGADPIVYFAPSGSAFYSTLPDIGGVPKSAIARSVDGGLTWTMTTALIQADRQWMAFQVRSSFSGRIYFTGTGGHAGRDGGTAISPYLARSDDDGLTFPFRSVVAYDLGADRSPLKTPELGGRHRFPALQAPISGHPAGHHFCWRP